MAADLTAQGEQGGSKHRFYGARNIDEGIAVMLYLLGESLVGWRAEDILICARALSEECGGQRVLLCVRGPLAVAAAHAYAAEPQLFEGVELEDKPLSWSEVVRKSDRFSFAETIQSGLRHYDWTDLLP